MALNKADKYDGDPKQLEKRRMAVLTELLDCEVMAEVRMLDVL